jgi:hypothetical protein
MSPFSSRLARARTAVLGVAAIATIIGASSGAAFAGGSRPKPPPPPPLVLVAPTSVTVAQVDATSVRVLIDVTPLSIKNYEIFLNGAPRPGNFYAQTVYDPKDSTLIGLTPDTSYVITVREAAFSYALNRYVTGPFSTPLTIRTLTRAQSAPTVPTNFRPLVIPYSTPVPHQLSFQWDQSTDNIDPSSNLDYRTYINGVSQGLVCAGSPYCFGESNITVSNLVPGATYRLSVEAIDRSGNTSARSADYVFVGI